MQTCWFGVDPPKFPISPPPSPIGPIHIPIDSFWREDSKYVNFIGIWACRPKVMLTDASWLYIVYDIHKLERWSAADACKAGLRPTSAWLCSTYYVDVIVLMLTWCLHYVDSSSGKEVFCWHNFHLKLRASSRKHQGMMSQARMLLRQCTCSAHVQHMLLRQCRLSSLLEPLLPASVKEVPGTFMSLTCMGSNYRCLHKIYTFIQGWVIRRRLRRIVFITYLTLFNLIFQIAPYNTILGT